MIHIGMHIKYAFDFKFAFDYEFALDFKFIKKNRQNVAGQTL